MLSKRIIALCSTFVILFSTVVPAHADYTNDLTNASYWELLLISAVQGSGGGNFGGAIQGLAGTVCDDVCQTSDDALHHTDSLEGCTTGVDFGVGRYALATCNYCGSEFKVYSEDLKVRGEGFTQEIKDEYGSTAIDSSGGLFIPYVHYYTEFGYYSIGRQGFYCEHADNPSASVSSVGLCSSSGDSVTITYLDCSRNSPFFHVYWVARFPFSGGKFSYLGSSEKHSSPSDNQVTSTTYSDSFNLPSSGEFTVTVTSPGGVIFYPSVSLDFEDGIFASSRPTSITGNYGIIGDDGSLTKIDTITIVNEGSSTYYNPVTNTSYDLSGWTYDYSTRTYNLTTADDNSVTVTYGDENVTINEGDTTYNVYYLVEAPSTGEDGDGTGEQPGIGGDDGSGDSADGESIWDKIGQLLGTVVDGILGLIEGVLGGLLDGLISLADMLAEKLSRVVDVIMSLFQEIPAMFTGFLDFLSAVFPFIPEEMMTLLTFGLAAVIFIGIISWFRR